MFDMIELPNQTVGAFALVSVSRTGKTVAVYTRHKPGCPKNGEPYWRRCRCIKYLYIYGDGDSRQISAKTRSWEPISTAKRKVIGKKSANADAVDNIMIRATDANQIQAAQDEAQALLRQRHHLQPAEDDDFSIRNMQEIFAAQEASSRVMSLMLAAVADGCGAPLRLPPGPVAG